MRLEFLDLLPELVNGQMALRCGLLQSHLLCMLLVVEIHSFHFEEGHLQSVEFIDQLSELLASTTAGLESVNHILDEIESGDEVAR